jgi:hypothetical protein
LEKERNQPNSAWAQSGPSAYTVGSARDGKQPTGPMPSARRMGAPWLVTVHCALVVAQLVRTRQRLPGSEADRESITDVRASHWAKQQSG